MSDKKIVFILDPGHGKGTPGKRSPEIPPGFYEWKFVREIVYLIKEAAEKSDDKKWIVESIVDYQFNKDLSLKLIHRCDIANGIATNSKEQCYFVSIHTNAAGNKGWYDVNGTTAFTCKNASEKSEKLASVLTKNISEITGLKNRGTKNKNFYVLKHTTCPAVLIEVLFHTSKYDCEIAMNEKDKIIDAFVKTFDEISESESKNAE